MPNRILKETICTSDTIDSLSWFEEILYYRLIVNCDDYGRFDGRIAVIKNRLFPLKENLTLSSVKNAINTLARVGLVSLYVFEGKPYLYLPSWNEHQQIRARKSKYPAPQRDLISSDINCNQMISNDIICSRNPIQSNTMNPNNESEYYESESKSEIEITTTTTTNAPADARSPSLSDIYTYLKENHDVVDYVGEATKFEAYNAVRGWVCLPNWQAAVDLWVARINDQQ